jgi:hypothetical protein
MTLKIGTCGCCTLPPQRRPETDTLDVTLKLDRRLGGPTSRLYAESSGNCMV